MDLHDEPGIDLLRRSDAERPFDDRKLRRAIADGRWTKVSPGSFALRAEWDRLSPREQHRTRVREAARRMRGPQLLVRHAAAALWGIDTLGPWPRVIDVACGVSTGGRSSGLIRRHGMDVPPEDTVPFGRHRVTSPARTALDLACALPHTEAVAAVDQAIWTGRAGGALASRDEILDLLSVQPDRRGATRAHRAISFAQTLAANVRESQSRVVIARLGFPVPRLQERRVLRTGRLVFGDFYFPAHDHWAELDGRGKYRSPDFGRGRDAASIAIDEKNRENEIRREVRGFSRWEPSDVDAPWRLYDILTSGGLPSALPRPSRMPRL